MAFRDSNPGSREGRNRNPHEGPIQGLPPVTLPTGNVVGLLRIDLDKNLGHTDGDCVESCDRWQVGS